MDNQTEILTKSVRLHRQVSFTNSIEPILKALKIDFQIVEQYRAHYFLWQDWVTKILITGTEQQIDLAKELLEIENK